jgi:hypothetical protein
LDDSENHSSLTPRAGASAGAPELAESLVSKYFMTTNAPAQADWDYISRMLETIKSFQAEEALSIQLELRHLRSELKGVRLCQEKLLQAQLSAGSDWSSLSDKGLCRTEGLSHLAPAVGGEKSD